MKLKIEVSFNDKYTDEEYVVGKVYNFEEERANELLGDPRSLVSLVEKPKKKDKKDKKEDKNPEDENSEDGKENEE